MWKKFLSESRDVLKLAIPAAGEMSLYMLVWVFDTMMIGRYGGDFSISVVGFSSEIIYTFFNIIVTMGISIGITSIIARFLGAKKISLAKKFASYGIFIGFFISIFLTLSLLFFGEKILIFFKANEQIIPQANLYMKVCSISVFFNTFSSILNGIFRGCKDTKTPLLGAFISNLINIFFDYTLIFGNFGFPELGIKGAGIATSIASLFCFLFLFYKCKTLPFKLNFKFNPTLKEFSNLISLAIPSGLQEAAFSIVRLLSVTMVMQLSTLAFSANQIAITIESFSFMPGWGFATSAVTLVGYSYGEKNYKKIKIYTELCLFFSCIIMGVFAIIFVFFSKNLALLFSDSKNVVLISLATSCLTIGSIQQIPTAIDMVLSGALKGLGDTKTPFFIVFFCNWFIRLPLMFYFIYVKKSCVTYFWYITSFQWLVEAAIFIFFYKRKLKNIISEYNMHN